MNYMKNSQAKIDLMNDFIDAVIGLKMYVYQENGLPPAIDLAFDKAMLDRHLLKEGNEIDVPQDN